MAWQETHYAEQSLRVILKWTVRLTVIAAIATAGIYFATSSKNERITTVAMALTTAGLGKTAGLPTQYANVLSARESVISASEILATSTAREKDKAKAIWIRTGIVSLLTFFASLGLFFKKRKQEKSDEMRRGSSLDANAQLQKELDSRG